jgi:hypothetical protein
VPSRCASLDQFLGSALFCCVERRSGSNRILGGLRLVYWVVVRIRFELGVLSVGFV